MSRALLDVHVLLDLFDADHAHHARAHEWLAEGVEHGWATCATTQNGFVRVISQARYPTPVPPTQAVAALRRACDREVHEFWSCDISLLDDRIIDPTRLHGPRQVTDAYLVALAVAHGGRLVTFDRSLPLSAVRGATAEHIFVL